MAKYQILNTKYSKKVIVAMVVLLVTLGLYKWYSSRTADAAWYGTAGWAFRKKLVIDYTKVSGAQVNFPVLVSITDNDLKSTAQSTGNDILFTSADGTTKLDHEIEKYTSGTGILVAWVRIPNLSATVDTEIYMYYGNPSAVSQQNKTGVWDSSFVGVWHLAETSGYHTNSTSVTGLTQDDGTVTQQGANIGIADGADEFDGTANKVGIPHVSAMLPSTAMTVEAWGKFDVLPMTKGVTENLTAKIVSGFSPAYELFVGSGANYPNFAWRNAVTHTLYTARSTTTPTVGNWFYLAGVHTGSALNIYNNGTIGSVTDTPTGTIDTTTPQRLTIGSNGSSNYFDGVVDEVRVSNTNRSAGWITTTYNTISSPSTFFKSMSQAQRGPASSVLYWRFDEASGSSANDSSGYSNTGTLGTGSTAPSWETSIVPYREDPSSLKFDGSNDYVSKVYSDDTELDVGSTSFSVGSWFHHPSTVTGTDTILSRYSGAGYKLYMQSDGTVCFGIDDDSTWGPDNSACSTSSYADSKWHHILAVKDNVSTITTYVDGNQVAQTAVTSTGSLSGTSPPLYVGIDSNGASNPWDGYIDEVKIYDGALTAAQVKADYNAKGSVKGTSASFGSGDPSKNLSQGLVGWWKMDETSWNGSANEVIDSSGNGNNGVGVGSTVPTTGLGKFGKGGIFNGVDNAVNAGSGTSLANLSALTVSAWIYPLSAGGNGASRIVDKAETAGPWNGWTFINQAGNALEFSVDYSDTNYVIDTANNVVNYNRWQLVTVTWDGSTDATKGHIYINGVETTYGTRTNAVGDRPSDSPYNLRIGNITELTRAFSGTIDDVRIYNRALSPAEVLQLYKWAPGPIAYYNFDEGTGTSALTDHSGNGINGTMSGFTNSSWKAGKYGNALYFNGSTSYIELPISGRLNMSGAYTIEMWYNAASWVNGADTRSTLLSYFSDTHRIQLINTPQLYVEWKDGGAYPNWAITNLSLNTWIHVATQFNGTNTISLYINGIKQADKTITNVANSGSYITLGRQSYDAIRYYKGLMDEVKFYNYARTPEQIIDDMNARGTASVGGNYGGTVAYYKFDEGYGSTAYNAGSTGSTVNGALGTGVSAPSWTNSGKYGKALILDGNSDYVYTSNAGIVAGSAASYSAVSFGGWFNPTTSVVSKTIIHKNNEFRLTTDSNSKPQCELYSSGAWQTAGVGASALSLSSWSHVLCTYDEANIKVYVNGIQSGASVAQTGSILSSSSTALNIGRDSANTGFFNGTIDEVKVYDFALSSDEVKVEYNHGKSTVLGSLSIGTGSTASSFSSAQEYCVPGDATSCAGPVGEWKMDENGGTSAYDTSGNGNTGNLGGGTTAYRPIWTTGKIGTGLNFDGNDDYVVVSDTSSLHTSNLTVSLWVKPDAWNHDSILIAKRSTYATMDWQLYYSAGGHRLYFTIGESGGANLFYNANVNPPLGSWTYITITKSGTTFTIYQNGILNTNTETSAVTWTDSDAVTLGAMTPSLPEAFFDGSLDQVRIFNYARTPAQIAWDYNRGAPTAWYKFDECTGSTAYDSAPNSNGGFNGYNGTIGIGATAPQTSTGTCNSGTASEAWSNGTSGKYNASLNFDGQDDKLTVTDNVNLRFNTSANDFSLFAWVKRSATGVIHYVISKEDADNDGYRLMINANNTVTCSEDATDVTSTLTISDTNWHHVGCTITRAGNGQVYIDGVATGAAVAMGSDAMATSSNVTIGTRSYTSTNYFNGQIDDARIYNYALTATQVKKLYNNDSAVYFGP